MALTCVALKLFGLGVWQAVRASAHDIAEGHAQVSNLQRNPFKGSDGASVHHESQLMSGGSALTQVDVRDSTRGVITGPTHNDVKPDGKRHSSWPTQDGAPDLASLTGAAPGTVLSLIAPLHVAPVAMQGYVADPSPAARKPAMLTAANIVSVAMWLALVFLIAYYYKFLGGKAFIMGFCGPNEEPLRPLVDNNNWRFGLFSCFDHPCFCIFSCCCGTIRWSDTVSMAGLLNFSFALSLLLVLSFLSAGFGRYTAWVPVVTVVLLAVYRQKLRKRFGIQHGDCATIVGDGCAYIWCSPCALTQEARQVELAAKEGQLSMTPP